MSPFIERGKTTMAVLLLDEFTSLDLINDIPAEDELVAQNSLPATALPNSGDIEFVVVASDWEIMNWNEEDLEIEDEG